MQLPEKDNYTESKKKLLAMLVSFMGGRAAEEIVFDDVTTGAQNDLKQATGLARMMVCEWGMSPLMGPQAFGNREEHFFMGREISRNNEYSEDTSRKIDSEISRLLKEAHDKAMHLLETHRDRLEKITELLLERETLDGQEVDEIVKHGRVLSEVERSEEASVGDQQAPEVAPSAAIPESPVTKDSGYVPPLSGAPGPDASPA